MSTLIDGKILVVTKLDCEDDSDNGLLFPDHNEMN
jgi:hypothetical protein